MSEAKSGIEPQVSQRVNYRTERGIAVIELNDPPANAYSYEMSDDEHEELAYGLRRCKGKVAISGYRCDLMNELYMGWKRIDAPEKM